MVLEAQKGFGEGLAWGQEALTAASVGLWVFEHDTGRGLTRLLTNAITRRLLGVHIVGEGATELVHIGQAVLNLKGTVEYFVENTFNYPTLTEAYKIAGLDAWNRMGDMSQTA